MPSLIFSVREQPDWVEDALRLPARVVRELPEEPETADPAFVLTEYGQNAFYELVYSDGTRFVLDGYATKLWGECSPPLTLEDLTIYLLGPVMGFVLRRRGVTALHASCVCLNGGAIVLCGPAGAGKSTTAAALALRGVSVLCEDICSLREKDGEFWVLPGYPRVCLWPDAVESLLGSPARLPQLTPTWDKRYLSLGERNARFEDKPALLKAVYFLAARSEDEGAPRIEKASRREALLQLVRNTYMNWLLTKEQRAEEFAVLARLTESTAFRRIVPHSHPAKLNALCELLEEDAARVSFPSLRQSLAGNP